MMTKTNTTDMTKEELQAIVNAAQQTASAEREAASAAANELKRRAEAEAEHIAARERVWAEWFYRIGYQQAHRNRLERANAARAELLDAIKADPVYQALAKYLAISRDERDELADQKAVAANILGERYSPPSFEHDASNPLEQLTPRAVDAMTADYGEPLRDSHRERRDKAVHYQGPKNRDPLTKYETALKACTYDPTAPKETEEDYLKAREAGARIEYTDYYHHDYGRSVRIIRDMDTGESLVVDPEYTRWLAQQPTIPDDDNENEGFN